MKYIMKFLSRICIKEQNYKEIICLKCILLDIINISSYCKSKILLCRFFHYTRGNY